MMSTQINTTPVLPTGTAKEPDHSTKGAGGETLPPHITARIEVVVTRTGQFLIQHQGETIRLHSEWQLAAFFTEVSKHGGLKYLKPEMRTQTYDEWIAAGHQVTVIAKPEYKPLPKAADGKVGLTLEELGL